MASPICVCPLDPRTGGVLYSAPTATGRRQLRLSDDAVAAPGAVLGSQHDVDEQEEQDADDDDDDADVLLERAMGRGHAPGAAPVAATSGSLPPRASHAGLIGEELEPADGLMGASMASGRAAADGPFAHRHGHRRLLFGGLRSSGVDAPTLRSSSGSFTAPDKVVCSCQKKPMNNAGASTPIWTSRRLDEAVETVRPQAA